MKTFISWIRENGSGLTLFLFLFLCIGYFFYHYYYTYQKPINSLKVGQIWKYTYGDGNPYKKPTIHYEKIIGMKDGYVLYISDEKDTMSSTEQQFVIGSKLYKDVK